MDEILTIRENDIRNLEKKVNLLNDALESKDKMLKDISNKLEEVQAKLEKSEQQHKQEKRILTKLSKHSDEPRVYSKSNERKETIGISQSTLPKKPVSRMYSSLYSSSQINPKGGNANNMKDYEKLYKDFLRSKRTENPGNCIEELWSQNINNLTQNRSNNGWNSKSTDVRSDSNTKWKKKKKYKDSDKKYSNKANTIRHDYGISVFYN